MVFTDFPHVYSPYQPAVAGIGVIPIAGARFRPARGLAKYVGNTSVEIRTEGHLTDEVAHDFNNLPTTILGSRDFVQPKPDDKALRDCSTMAALGAVRRESASTTGC